MIIVSSEALLHQLPGALPMTAYVSFSLRLVYKGPNGEAIFVETETAKAHFEGQFEKHPLAARTEGARDELAQGFTELRRMANGSG